MADSRNIWLDRLAPHQKNAVVRLEEILSQRWGAILADEPGLGKTFVAAAVAARRQSDRMRVEVVVPASLRLHWRGILEAFEVDARIVTHTSLALQEAGTDRSECDLVIVDEAHRFRNPTTKRYRALSARSVNTHLLLVTATPVCNSPVDLLQLLRLIAADDELEANGVPSIEQCFVSCNPNLAVLLREFCVRHSFDESEAGIESFRGEVVQYPPVHNRPLVDKRLQDLTFPWTDGRVARRLMLLFLRRRLESSVAALRASLKRMRRVCGRAAGLARRGKSLSAGEIRRVFGDPDAETYQDILFPGLWGATERVGGADSEEFRREIRRLLELDRVLTDDPKIAILESVIRRNSGVPGLVFTGSYDTASSLQAVLSGTMRCALLSGRQCLVATRRTSVRGVVEAMAGGQLDLIIATDLGAEGLNLQAAGFVVHYDLPWNPAIVEQRNGRILRIGQKRRRLEAIYMIPDESHVLPVLASKRETNSRFLEATRPGSSFEAPDEGWFLPPRLEMWRPQVALLARLRTENLVSIEISDLLSFAYRAGVERCLTETLQQPIGRGEVDRLIRMLRNEWQVGFRRGRSHIIRS